MFSDHNAMQQEISNQKIITKSSCLKIQYISIYTIYTMEVRKYSELNNNEYI